jgi:hypothetical protein
VLNANGGAAKSTPGLTLRGKSPTLPPHEKLDAPHCRHYYYPTLNWWVGLQVIDRELLKPAHQAGFFVMA